MTIGHTSPMHPEGHHRRSIRLPSYDYRGPGAYFVTVCAYNRQCLFGEIADGEMRLNECGQVISDEWSRTADVRHNVALDAFVVMPNHIHGIIIITHPEVGANRRLAPTSATPATPYEPSPRLAPTSATPATPYEPSPRVAPTGTTPAPPRAGSVGAIMAQFKSIATKRVNGMRGSPGAPIWQRNYYEHIIRDEESLHRIQEYIITNPLRWAQDSENPAATEHDEFDAWLDAQGEVTLPVRNGGAGLPR